MNGSTSYQLTRDTYYSYAMVHEIVLSETRMHKIQRLYHSPFGNLYANFASTRQLAFTLSSVLVLPPHFFVQVKMLIPNPIYLKESSPLTYLYQHASMPPHHTIMNGIRPISTCMEKDPPHNSMLILNIYCSLIQLL